MTKNDTSNQFWENFNEWIYYWRQNIHRFCMEYLGLKVHLFQQILLYLMDSPTNTGITSFIFFASRGIGKSYLTMMFCIAKCILYPGIKIKVASATIKQAVMFAQKINDIKEGRPNVEREILGEPKINKDGAIIEFRSGSTIEAVVCSPNARGARANILILDESNLMDEEIINTVLSPFLTLTHRNQPWAQSPKWEKYALQEHNSKIYLTSIGYKDEWSYKDFLQYIDFITKDGRDDYFAFSLPYQFGIEAGVIGKSYIESKIREGKSDAKTLKMEFEVIPYGESESSVFKYEHLNRARKLIVPLIPPTDEEYISCKGDLRKLDVFQKKEQGEIRAISMDIAISAGRANDNTVFCVWRAFNNGDHYLKELAYIEVMNGVNLDPQILRLKQLFYDLECDYAILDANGAIGIQACAEAGKVSRDVFRNKQYPGFRTCNKCEKFDIRVADPSAVPVLFTVQASGVPQMNYNMCVVAQLEFDRNRISLLTHEENIVDTLNHRYGYMKLSSSLDYADRQRALNMIMPFNDTSELVRECVKTQIVKTPSGKFVLDEKNGRKDRMMSMVYGIYFLSELEKDLYDNSRAVDISEYFTGTTNVRTASSTNPFARVMGTKGFNR